MSRKFIDLTGQRFGRLTAVRKVPSPSENNTSAFWEVLCNCGVIKIVAGGNLRSGQTKSCGCLNKESIPRYSIDLVGQVFGNLTVIQRTKHPTRKEAGFWLCLCICGNKTIVESQALKRGTTQSCGCKQQGRGMPQTDKTGKVYGYLTVINQATTPTGKTGVFWKCICMCGNTRIVSTKGLTGKWITSCGCLNKQRARIDDKAVYRSDLPKHVKRWLMTIRGQYNLLPTEWTTLVLNSNGRCYMCPTKFGSGSEVAIDHDHISNRVRGLLCHYCNRALGFLENNELKLRSEVYIKRYGSTTLVSTN